MKEMTPEEDDAWLRNWFKRDKAIESLQKDAERYRWLRAQHWSTLSMCVVAFPKSAVKLGHLCPSEKYLDERIDEEIAKESEK